MNNTDKNGIINGKDPISGRFVKGNKLSEGRTKGQKSYSTLYKEALIKLAKLNGKTDEEIELDMLMKGIAESIKGDYRFYRDTLDRLHGTPVQKTELTGKDGKDLIPDIVTKEKIDEAISSYINGNTKDTRQE